MKAASQPIKKFFKHVRVEPSTAVPQHYHVLLDNRKVKTRDLHLLTTPSHELAHMVKFEYLAQQEYIIQSTLPMAS